MLVLGFPAGPLQANCYLLAAGDVIGSVRLTGMIVPPRVYDHLRWSNREAA